MNIAPAGNQSVPGNMRALPESAGWRYRAVNASAFGGEPLLIGRGKVVKGLHTVARVRGSVHEPQRLRPQDRPSLAVRWPDVPCLLVRVRRCLAAWQQRRQQRPGVLVLVTITRTFSWLYDRALSSSDPSPEPDSCRTW